MSAEGLRCPACGAAVGPSILPPPRRKARSFECCERRCDPCGVGYSNGQQPTTIYRDPRDNLPFEVRDGALDAIRGSLNELNRSSKEVNFGFSTSEDAVTWTVFSWLATQSPAGLIRLGERLGLTSASAPSVLLWGVPVPANPVSDTRDRIIAALDALGERSASRTEPDVCLDYGAAGVVLIEVKHKSENKPQRLKDADKFDRYVLDTGAFADPQLATRSAHYELARNWRLGHDLAGDRPFRLVNLGPTMLFRGRAGQSLDSFEATLARGDRRAFVRLTWADLLSDTQAATGPLPTWLAGWLSHRGISP
jgi:hypothetical protein